VSLLIAPSAAACSQYGGYAWEVGCEDPTNLRDCPPEAYSDTYKILADLGYDTWMTIDECKPDEVDLDETPYPSVRDLT
jgi:hypothetical protein